MKNATKHADELKTFLKKQVKQHSGEIPDPETIDPLRALVRACLAFDTSDSRADDAMEIVDREFVDLNELRVATELECIEIIGPRFPDIETRVATFIQCLNGIFAREHTLSLERLRTIPKREARQFLRELPAITPFVEASTMLYGFGATNVFPADETISSLLKEEEVVENEATIEEVQKFVEQSFKEDDAYKLFWCLRHRKKK